MPYGKPGPGYCITFIKKLDEDSRLQVLGQKPLITLKSFRTVLRQKQNP